MDMCSELDHGAKDVDKVLTWFLNSPHLNLIQHLLDVLEQQVTSMEAPPHNLTSAAMGWYQIPVCGLHASTGLLF